MSRTAARLRQTGERTRAHLLEMSGDTAPAIAEYRAAADRTNSLPEQRYLLKRAAALNEKRG